MGMLLSTERMSRHVPFNRPKVSGHEYDCLREAVASGRLAGNGPFTAQCHAWLQERVQCQRALLTHSCTGALEMAALIADVQPGDEVILPSFTFVSTANAFVLRGAVPVFVDIRPDTLNLDEALVEAAVNGRTRAIVPVHYAGVGCDMARIGAIAERDHLVVIEDAAQSLLARQAGRPLGSFGQLAALSFHETKNVVAGEAGALLINDQRFVERAQIIWEKGTDRSRFLEGKVDKYTWQDVGSSFQCSDITAAFLWAQLNSAESITCERLSAWHTYHDAFEPFEQRGLVRRPIVPAGCEHNAHLYYLLLPSGRIRADVLARLNAAGVNAIFHYVPLHLSPAGRRFGRVVGSMVHTETLSAQLVRLPLWAGMSREDLTYVIDHVGEELERTR
jgi:dTDP-4-amino-4,6-dideoxygalactose transaminase